MVLARSRQSAGLLGDALRGHLVERVYRARVGVLLPVGLQGVITDPLKWAGGKTWVDPSGVRAETRWTVISQQVNASELEVELSTGRMHQIRVHLAHRLSPIVGDRKYRGSQGDKLYLRAIRLRFQHPISKQALCFEVDGF